MKYRKHEAKEYAKSVLKGVWTALPTNFTAEGGLDEAAVAGNLGREVLQSDVAVRKEGQPLHDVTQLADVAGPVIMAERLARGGRQGERLLWREAAEKMIGE